MHTIDFIQTFYHKIKYTWIDLKLQKEVKKCYYRDKNFSKIDRMLLQQYIFKNPYTISKNYLKNQGQKEIDIYGETPLMTYETIANKVKLKPTDTFLELGSGRGRGAFFIHYFFKCAVIGIEQIPDFVTASNAISKRYDQRDIHFICKDIFQATLPRATVIYLYGTGLPDHQIILLAKRLTIYPKGTKIISISYPLTDYDETNYQIEYTFPVSFPWGQTKAYVQVVTNVG